METLIASYTYAKYGSPNLPDKSKFGYYFLQKTKNQVDFISKLKKYCIFLSKKGSVLWA